MLLEKFQCRNLITFSISQSFVQKKHLMKPRRDSIVFRTLQVMFNLYIVISSQLISFKLDVQSKAHKDASSS